jgi:RNA polymerase sigma factor (TIGR02999 family)
VHEAYVRLLGQEARFANRVHFFAVAAEMIRRVLVDHVRARQARKRGGDYLRVELGDIEVAQGPRNVDLLALDRVLEELAARDTQLAHVVELHYFGGLTFDEIAEVRGTSSSAAKRDWTTARAWLHLRLRTDAAPRGGRA